MNREKKLIKNTFILSIGNICTKLITFFLLPLYTSVLSTEEYGIVDLLNTLITLMLPMITFQIEQGAFRFLLESKDDKTRKEIISSSFFIVVFQLIFYVIIFILFSNFINNNYKWYLILNLICYSFSTIFQQYSRGLDRNTIYASSSFISALSSILFNILFLVCFKFGAAGMLIANAIGQLICSIFIFISLKLNNYISIKSIEKKCLSKMLKFSFPLIPNSLCWWVFNASDRIIVSIFLGMSMTGILSASSKFAAFYIIVYNVFHLSWIENISEHVDDNDINIYYNKMFNRMFKIFSSISLLIVGLTPICYNIIINNNYFYGYYQVPITMIAAIFNVLVSLESAIFIAKKSTKSLAIQALLAAIINLMVNLLLINKLGLFASSISTFVSYLVLFVIRHWEINNKYFKIVLDNKIMLFCLVFFIIEIPIYYLNKYTLNIMGAVFTIIYISAFNYKNILNIYIFVKRSKIYERIIKKNTFSGKNEN